MSSDKKYESPVTDQALIREVFPNAWPKRLAKLMDVPVHTARHWFYARMSNARRRDLAIKLLQEMDEDDRRRERHELRRQEVRRQLQQIAGGDVEL